jgi:hypothetical protein
VAPDGIHDLGEIRVFGGEIDFLDRVASSSVRAFPGDRNSTGLTGKPQFLARSIAKSA